MKRASNVKFPHSVQLFKFCQKVLTHQRGIKVRDQEVGQILNFNPSDCSHWKRGEKNVKSVFALAKLAEALQVEPSLVHDVASGSSNLDEGFFEFLESREIKNVVKGVMESFGEAEVNRVRDRVHAFVDQIHRQCEFTTAPLYLPEVMRTFSFVATQPTEMIDKLSRILRVKTGQYSIQFRKGDLKAQTRQSVVKDLARIIFEGERARFPELGPLRTELTAFEGIVFAADLLAPKSMVLEEMAKLDLRRNVVSELASLFWVPKSLVCFQMQEVLRTGRSSSLRSGELGQNGLNPNLAV